MLGRLGMSVEECIRAYKNMMRGIFEQSQSAKILAKVPMYASGKIKPSYSSEKLRDAITELCKERRIRATDRLDDGVDRRCKTVPSTKSIKESLRLFATDTMPSLISETERTEKRIVARWRHELDEGRFFRFNVDHGLRNVGLADYQQEGLINTGTTTYLNHQIQLSRVANSSLELKKTIHRFTVAHNYTEQCRLRAENPSVEDHASGKEIMDSLYFAEHDARLKMLESPHENTYDWIFSSPKGRSTSHDFTHWLRYGSEIFWISGKLGSGKSTLMAHILHDERTAQELQAWAQPAHLHIISFFFWRAGTQQLQNTIPGLLRSLIFQLLDQIPGLAEVMGKRCQLRTRRIALWEENSLRTSLHEAISAAKNVQLCFFIDGLDESQGDYNKLAKEVCSIFQRHSHAKLCVSSRPEEPLKQRFAAYPMLEMEQLNFLNIKQYVVAQIGAYGLQYDQLILDICWRADGVFLWAVVVTREVVLGIQSGDDAEILEKRVQQLSPEMEKLFDALLQSIDKLHKGTLAFYLNVMSLVTDVDIVLPTVALLAAALSNDGFVSYTHFAEQCETRRRQICAYSKGLLETSRWSEAEEDKTTEEYMWSVSHKGFRDMASNGRNIAPGLPLAIKARRATAFSSHSTKCIAEMQVARYLLCKVGWSHRSAYDFVAKQEVQTMLGLHALSAKPGVIAKLLQGHLWLLATAPSKASYGPTAHGGLLPTPSERMVRRVEFIVNVYDPEQEDVHGPLDQLRDLVKYMEQDGMEGGPDRRVKHCMPGKDSSTLCGRQPYKLRTSPDIEFWCCCMDAKLTRYVHDWAYFKV
ncbi:hypothetical protein LTR49_020563 [Elasticomyces elasticus]|nr:hypothetical protein LTR49_020563 [Elasticomyces elasticus]